MKRGGHKGGGHRLAARLAETAAAWGARRAQVVWRNGSQFLVGFDGRDQPFSFEITGDEHDWHVALDRLAQEVVRETNRAGLCRFLNHANIHRHADTANKIGATTRAA